MKSKYLTPSMMYELKCVTAKAVDSIPHNTAFNELGNNPKMLFQNSNIPKEDEYVSNIDPLRDKPSIDSQKK